MSSNFQFEIHPDAEVLNAFAEQALLPEERAEVLAHLGGCSRCREIVFLAAAADCEEEAAAPVAAQPAEPRLAGVHGAGQRNAWLREWFAGWRLAWILACAVTAVVLVALAVHMRRTGEGTEMARVTPAPAVRAEMQTPAPQAQSGKTAAAPHAAAAPAKAKPAEEKAEGILAARVAALPNKSVPLADNEAFRALGLENDTKASPPAPQFAVASVGVPGTHQEDASALNQLQERAGNGVSRATNSGFEPSRGMNLRVASVEPEAYAPRAASVMKNAAMQEELASVQKSVVRLRAISLPNGEAPASTVGIQPRVLALAGDGTLYLSQNAGLHWQAVAAQWTGKAVTVRLRGESAAGREKAVEKAASVGESAPRVFELVNDKGHLWVSSDGLTWTAE
jgi:hypothetical protein